MSFDPEYAALEANWLDGFDAIPAYLVEECGDCGATGVPLASDGLCRQCVAVDRLF